MCVGENQHQREEGNGKDVIREQLEAIKSSVNDWTKIVIAYEPVWANAANKNVSAQDAQEMHEVIRKWLVANSNEATANLVRIIYGGSTVTEKIAD